MSLDPDPRHVPEPEPPDAVSSPDRRWLALGVVLVVIAVLVIVGAR